MGRRSAPSRLPRPFKSQSANPHSAFRNPHSNRQSWFRQTNLVDARFAEVLILGLYSGRNALCPIAVRVDQIVACEMSTLWSRQSALWRTAPAMPSLSSHVADPAASTRSPGTAPARPDSHGRGRRWATLARAGRAHAPSGECSVSSGAAGVRAATTRPAPAGRGSRAGH